MTDRSDLETQLERSVYLVQQQKERRRMSELLAAAAWRLESLSTPEPATGCVLWLGSSDRKGYGRLSVGSRPMLAHRAAWALRHGDPGDLCVLHRCDTPQCVNPDHLFLGTRLDNARDMTAKGRQKGYPRLVTCRKGHPMSGDNLYLSPDGARACKACKRELCRKRRAAPGVLDAERARARELYHLNLEENRRKACEKQRRIRERHSKV